MKVYLGESGLDKSWQLPFSKTTKCYKCGGTARIMFVGFEDNLSEKECVCNLKIDREEGKFWPHDYIACAVYLCQSCFEPVAILNQA